MTFMYRRGFLQLLTATAALGPMRRVWAANNDRVVVIGAGIMGATIAYHLAKRGAQVTIIDKEGPAAGTTKNSFAWLNASGKAPQSYYELNVAGMMGWRRLEREIGSDLQVQWGGSLSWAVANQEQVQARRKRMAERQALGYPIREIKADEIVKLVTGVVPGQVDFADFCDIEGTVDPVVVTNVLVSKAKGFGASAIYPCEIKAFDLDADRVRGVQTTKGKFEADHVIIAAGNATPGIAAMAGLDVPLIESKGILAHSKPQPMVLNRIIRPPSGDAKQNFDGRVVTGRDFGESGNMKPDAELGKKYFDNLAQYFPAASSMQLDYMTLGYRVMPKDGHPIVDRSSKYPNLHVVAQHSGMTCAPIVGQLVSIEVLDGVAVKMLEPYRLARFA